MSFGSALALSFKNLLTKKGRTFITAFAGSIGIIGIALILSLSNGVNEYIAGIEEDTLASYPITIEETMIDSSAMLTSFENSVDDSENRELNKIYSNDIMVDMISLMTSKISTNNLEKFKKYLDSNNEIKDYVNEIKYSYNVGLNVYKDDSKNVTKVNPSPVFDKLGMGNNFAMTADVWQQLMDSKDYLESQYEVVAGKLPENYNEIVLISDFVAPSFSLKSLGELSATIMLYSPETRTLSPFSFIDSKSFVDNSKVTFSVPFAFTKIFSNAFNEQIGSVSVLFFFAIYNWTALEASTSPVFFTSTQTFIESPFFATSIFSKANVV